MFYISTMQPEMYYAVGLHMFPSKFVSHRVDKAAAHVDSFKCDKDSYLYSYYIKMEVATIVSATKYISSAILLIIV